MENKTSLLEKIYNNVPVVLTFLLPLFFLPITTEFFEFNKLILLTAATILLMVLWALRSLLGKSLDLTRSILDIPLMVFIGVILLSTIFSVDKVSSIYGGVGRWFPSLFGYLTFFVFYYLVSSGITNLKAIKNTLFGLVLASGISSLISILSYFGIYLAKVDYMQITNFTVTGSIFGAIFLASLGIIVAMGAKVYETNTIKKAILALSVIINLTLMILINNLLGWIILGFGLILLTWALKPATVFKEKAMTVFMLGFAGALLLAVNVAPTKDLIVNKNYPREINLPIKESWMIASSVVRDYPFLATGPSTFQIDFSLYRPMQLNTSAMWNVRFDKPFNEIFNILSTMGIVGLLAISFLGTKMFKLLRAGMKAKEENPIIRLLSVLALVICASFLLTYATILNTYLLFVVLALLIRSMHAEKTFSHISKQINVKLTKTARVVSLSGEEVETTQNSYLKLVFSIPMLILSGFAMFAIFKNYSAEFYTRMSILEANKSDWNKVYALQEKAILANPERDIYYIRHAQTSLSLANNIAAKEVIEDKDKEVIQTLLARAITSTKQATEVVNPLNVKNWETRAVIYKSIMQATKNAYEWSVSSYNTAIQLDPTNPKLRLDLGGLFFANKDYLSAASQFKQAVNLKSDYANAYYNLAQALSALGDYQNAKATLEVIKTLVPQDSTDYKLVESEIAVISAKIPEVAGANTNKPTVEQIVGNKATEVNQEPLTTVGQEEKTNLSNETLPANK